MRSTAAATRYARALFSLAQDDDSVKSIRAELADMERLLASNPDLHRRLFQPLHPVDERPGCFRACASKAAGVRRFKTFLAS